MSRTCGGRPLGAMTKKLSSTFDDSDVYVYVLLLSMATTSPESVLSVYTGSLMATGWPRLRNKNDVTIRRINIAGRVT